VSPPDNRDPLHNDDHLLKRSLTPTDAVAGGACLDAETLAAWAEGSTQIPGGDELERHLASCARCQAMLASFANAEVAETEFAGASTPAAANRSPVVPFRPAWQRWVPIAVGALAASLVIYAAWPKHGTLERPRPAQTMASGAAATEPPPVSIGDRKIDEPALAKAKPSDTRAELKTQPSGIVRSARQASPAPKSAAVPAPSPVPPPEPLRVPAGAAPPVAAGATRGLTLATPPPATIDGVLPKPAEVNMLRSVEETTLLTANARVVAEFGAPTTTPPSATQALIGRAGAGGGGAGRGGGGGAGGVTGAARAIARVSWRVLSSGQVERSINAGETWALVTILPAVTVVNGVAPSSSVCWLIGKGGIVLRSTDGVTFRRVQSPDVADLRSITAIDELQATVTTVDGRVFKTIDGGDNWKEGAAQDSVPQPF
jgi:hypothetical protein